MSDNFFAEAVWDGDFSAGVDDARKLNTFDTLGSVVRLRVLQPPVTAPITGATTRGDATLRGNNQRTDFP